MVDLKIKLPEHFLEEEERCGYLVSSKMKQVWAVELDLLAEFMRVCDKYNLKYYADGGTMLGTIRHNGFIPWDDDIDIAMPREDYDILCSIAGTEFNHPYFFQTAVSDSNNNYPRLHAQLRNSDTTGILMCEWKEYSFNQGIFIDIFPFDNIPDNEKDVNSLSSRLIMAYDRFRFHLDYTSFYHHSNDPRLIKRLKHSVKHFLSVLLFDRKNRTQHLFSKTIRVCRMFNGIESKRFANLSLPYFTLWHRNFFLKEWYRDTYISKFEFLTIPVPYLYEDYLTTLYGDWQKLVRSKSTHGDTFFDVDRSYSFYLNPDKSFIE